MAGKRYYQLDVSMPQLEGAFGSVEPQDELTKAVARLTTLDGRRLVQIWVDPREKYWRGNQMRNSFTQERPAVIPVSSGSLPTTFTFNTNVNGKPTVTVSRAMWELEFNPGPSWTVIGAVRPLPDPGTSTSNTLFGHPGPNVAGYGSTLGIMNTGRLVVWNGPNVTVRLQSPEGVDYRNTPHILAATLNPTTGIALHADGVEVARNAADTNPSTQTITRVFGHILASGGHFEGDSTVCLALNADISLPEYAQARDAIYAYLADRSGITI